MKTVSTSTFLPGRDKENSVTVLVCSLKFRNSPSMYFETQQCSWNPVLSGDGARVIFFFISDSDFFWSYPHQDCQCITAIGT